MIRDVLVIAVAAAVLAAPAGAMAQDRQGDPFEWSGRIEQGDWIRIRNLNGAIRVMPADGEEVRVTAEKRWRRGDPEEVRFEVVEDGGDVTICALWGERSTCGPDGEYRIRSRRDDDRRTNDVSVEFTVHVPRGVRSDLSTVNGGVDVEGARAEVVARTVNGGIAASTSSGPVSAETVNGAVRVRMSSLPAEGDMEFSTVNGSVTAELPADLDAEIEMSTVNGSLRSDFPLTLQGRVNPRRLHATIGDGGRRLELKTVNGSITLRKLD